MSIIITNVSSDEAPIYGENNYLVRINDKVICNFTHDRKPDGLAQCLRDAAIAVDLAEKNTFDRVLNLIETMTDKQRK